MGFRPGRKFGRTEVRNRELVCCWNLGMLSKSSLLLLAPALLLSSSVKIEQRDVALWPTGNTLRFRQPDSTPKGRPVWVDTELPAKFNPDSLRVLPDGLIIAVPAKVEWRAPKARISWLSTGAPGYT